MMARIDQFGREETERGSWRGGKGEGEEGVGGKGLGGRWIGREMDWAGVGGEGFDRVGRG